MDSIRKSTLCSKIFIFYNSPLPQDVQINYHYICFSLPENTYLTIRRPLYVNHIFSLMETKESKNIKQPKNNILIFIPVYNEAEYVEEILEEVRNSAPNIDILVIDDGSTDNTPQILEKETGLHYLRHSENEGYGKTLIDGFEFAIARNYQYIITMDCDKQHQPDEIIKFTEAVKDEDWDIVSGSRYLEVSNEKSCKVPEDRKKINNRITGYINSLTGYNLTDSFCGFKLYKVTSLKKLKLTEHGYGMPLELWIQAWRHNFKIKEVPVALIYLDRDRDQTSSYRKVFRRYRYYLNIINKAIKDHENTGTGRTPR